VTERAPTDASLQMARDLLAQVPPPFQQIARAKWVTTLIVTAYARGRAEAVGTLRLIEDMEGQDGMTDALFAQRTLELVHGALAAVPGKLKEGE
jgi:hypothetical protein